MTAAWFVKGSTLLLLTALAACKGEAEVSPEATAAQVVDSPQGALPRPTSNGLGLPPQPVRTQVAAPSVKPQPRIYNFDSPPGLEPLPVEVAGIKLRMTANEVEAILNSSDRLRTAQYAGKYIGPVSTPGLVSQRSVKPRNFVASNPEFVLTDITVPDKAGGQTHDDSLYIMFAMPPEPAVVIAVHRKLNLFDTVKKAGPLETAYLSALEEKYGKPSSVKEEPYNNGTKGITWRWLYAGEEDCNPDSVYINFPENYPPPILKQPNTLPDPDTCKGSLHVRLLVITSGEYQGVATQALTWLGNDGDLYINQKRVELHARAIHAEWLAKRQQEIQAGAVVPKL